MNKKYYNIGYANLPFAGTVDSGTWATIGQVVTSSSQSIWVVGLDIGADNAASTVSVRLARQDTLLSGAGGSATAMADLTRHRTFAGSGATGMATAGEDLNKHDTSKDYLFSAATKAGVPLSVSFDDYTIVVPAGEYVGVQVLGDTNYLGSLRIGFMSEN